MSFCCLQVIRDLLSERSLAQYSLFVKIVSEIHYFFLSIVGNSPFPLFLLFFILFPISIPIHTASAGNQTIVVNEIAWMGIKENSYAEWIELYNNTNEEINLAGYTITTDSGLIITLSGQISALNYFLLLKQTAGEMPKIAADQTYSGKSLRNNEGERLLLKDKGSNIIEEINCSQGWFAGKGSPEYQTMERKNAALSGNDASNWQTSAAPGGTPKAQNSPGAVAAKEQSAQQEESSSEDITTTETTAQANKPPIASAGLDIVALTNQEIIFDASQSIDPENAPLTYLWNFGDGFTSSEIKTSHQYSYSGTYIVSLSVSDGINSATDTLTATIYIDALLISEFIPNPEGKDEENEWIEIFNKSDKITNISFWKIATEAKEFSLPANTLISPFSFLVLSRNATKISLPNSNGAVKLLYPNGQISQEIKYGKTKQGQSIAMESANKYTWTIIPTPGSQNIISSSGKPNNQISASLTDAIDTNYLSQNLISGGEMIIAKTPLNDAADIIIPQTQPSEISAAEDNMSASSGNISENNVENQLKTAQSSGEVNKKPFSSASLAEKITSPAVFIPIVIALGLGTGISLAKIRRKLKNKNPSQKFTIDWQD